jgi:alcohol dehydrogenase (cytochrome c)
MAAAFRRATDRPLPAGMHLRRTRDLRSCGVLKAAGTTLAIAGLLSGALALTGGALLAQGAPEQMEVGSDDPARAAYAQHCAVCHGENLDGGPFAPALKGARFLEQWGGTPLDELGEYMRSSMPPANAGGLPDATYAALAHMLADENGGPSQVASLQGEEPIARMPEVGAGGGSERFAGIGGLSSRVPVPAWPEPLDPLASFTPVTDVELDSPDPDDWPRWRRNLSGHGYSPLTHVNTANASQLRVAWSQALPPGANMNEPIVRDGVLFAFGYGDEVFAFDATNGRLLWRYRRNLPEGVRLSSRKTMSLYGDKLFVATSDLHLVALDARTGRPVWDKVIASEPTFRIPGGPLAAGGVVMQGLQTMSKGGGRIVGFDAASGERLWQFDTVAKEGTPGGDTWNGIPSEDRSGGSVWSSGTYDMQTGLASWGTAPTYDTAPLLTRKPGHNNDALYTDTTLALEPRTGKLAWYYQHMKNDQYDLDWVFERVIGELPVDGEPRRVIMTSGKEGLFDRLDAETGKNLDTLDMGFQNFIVSVDEETGEKTVDPALRLGQGKPVLICPHFGSGRNWMPTSFNPETRFLFVPVRDTCIDLVPAEGGFPTSGVDIQMAARPGSDGRYGVVVALDMQERKVAWQSRQRAPFTMGMLATAGGLLFTGSIDQQFVAFDQATGRELWREGVTGVPNAAPITYAVNGKQYVAMVTGHGNPISNGIPDLTPELQLPPVNNSAIVVFALPGENGSEAKVVGTR